jgi:tetratricopeptide (TPR) repeat protein
MAQERFRKLEAMLAQKPDDAFLRYALALEHKAEGRLTEAAEALESLRQLHPQYLPTYYQLGNLRAALGQLEQAIAIFQQGETLAQQQGEQKTCHELEAAREDAEDRLDEAD